MPMVLRHEAISREKGRSIDDQESLLMITSTNITLGIPKVRGPSMMEMENVYSSKVVFRVDTAEIPGTITVIPGRHLTEDTEE